MEEKANSKLLAQDDIDALLGEAGLEGGYDSKTENEAPSKRSDNNSIVTHSNVTDGEVHEVISSLLAKAVLKRDDNVKVIWNAVGTIPMTTGSCLNIKNIEFESLKVLKNNHLVVRQKSVESQVA